MRLESAVKESIMNMRCQSLVGELIWTQININFKMHYANIIFFLVSIGVQYVFSTL